MSWKQVNKSVFIADYRNIELQFHELQRFERFVEKWPTSRSREKSREETNPSMYKESTPAGRTNRTLSRGIDFGSVVNQLSTNNSVVRWSRVTFRTWRYRFRDQSLKHASRGSSKHRFHRERNFYQTCTSRWRMQRLVSRNQKKNENIIVESSLEKNRALKSGFRERFAGLITVGRENV